MKGYFYIMITENQQHLHCGDIEKTIKFYKDLPTIFLDPDKKLMKLIYIEVFQIYDNAISRFKEVSTFNRQQKDELINYVNPERIELVPGVNIEF